MMSKMKYFLPVAGSVMALFALAGCSSTPPAPTPVAAAPAPSTTVIEVPAQQAYTVQPQVAPPQGGPAPHSVWVQGHYNYNGRWVPGHYNYVQ